MKKSKKEAIVVAVCIAVVFLAGIVLEIVGCDWAIEAMTPSCLFIFLVYSAIQCYREEKPIYDRAKRIKALREQSQQ